MRKSTARNPPRFNSVRQAYGHSWGSPPESSMARYRVATRRGTGSRPTGVVICPPLAAYRLLSHFEHDRSALRQVERSAPLIADVEAHVMWCFRMAVAEGCAPVALGDCG